MTACEDVIAFAEEQVGRRRFSIKVQSEAKRNSVGSNGESKILRKGDGQGGTSRSRGQNSLPPAPRHPSQLNLKTKNDYRFRTGSAMGRPT